MLACAAPLKLNLSGFRAVCGVPWVLTWREGLRCFSFAIGFMGRGVHHSGDRQVPLLLAQLEVGPVPEHNARSRTTTGGASKPYSGVFAVAALLIASGLVVFAAATANAQGRPDNCHVDLTGDGAVSGTWAEGCDSSARAGRYARFYTFNVSQRGAVTIDLRSSVDTVLYLRSGNDQRSGAQLRSDDDGGVGTNSRISATLAAGSYTIEATTYSRFRTGHFTLELSGTGTTSPTGPTATTDARFSETCTVAVSGNGSITGTWASDCESTERPGSFARFYTFRVSQPRLVSIELRSSEIPMLFLRDGEDERASLSTRSDNISGRNLQTARIASQYPLLPGVYTVEATTWAPNSTGRFTLELSGVDFVPTPAQIAACGETLPGDGAYSGSWTDACESSERYGSYARYYTFTVQRQGLVIIEIHSSVDSYLYLRRGNDERSAFHTYVDDNSGTGTNALLSTVLGPGEYTVEAATASPSRAGQFRIELAGTGNQAPQTATPDPIPTQDDRCGVDLSGDGTHSGSWTADCVSTARTSSHAVFYTFTMPQRGQVDIDLRSRVDTYMYLRSGDDVRSGGFLRRDDDGGSGTNSRIVENLNPGAYTIEATTYARSRTGAFELEISGAGSASTPQPVPDPTPQPTIDCGSALTGDGTVSSAWTAGCRSLVRAANSQFYTFTVPQRALVTIDLRSRVDTYMYLRSGDDVRSGGFLRRDDDGGSGTNSRIVETLDPGAYTIEASTYAPGRTGSFELELSGTRPANTPQPVPDPTPPPTIDCGSALTGNGQVSGTWTAVCRSRVRPGRYAQFYTFTVPQRALVTIDLRSSVDTYMYLRSGNDQESTAFLRYDDDGGSGSDSRIRESLRPGTYTIEATTFRRGETGAFTLELSGL